MRHLCNLRLAAAALLLPSFALAQADPALQLQRLQPALFDADNTRSAAMWGVQAVRLVQISSELRELGFLPGDHVIAVQGQGWSGAAPRQPLTGAAVYTVLRQLPGERPVLEAAIVGRQMLTEFVALPASQRTPMRLTRMVANAWTLMRRGTGVLLLPTHSGHEDAQWLQHANPLPAPSEEGVQQVEAAVTSRTELPQVDDTEAAAAQQALQQGNALVAQERASRALMQWVVDPQGRQRSAEFSALVELYISAVREYDWQRKEFLTPSPLFGVFLEGSTASVQALLPQHTLIAVENSNGVAVRGGVRMRLLRWFDLMASYGIQKNTWNDEEGREKISTTLQPILLELAYRPMLLSRLKPVLRVGGGLYILETSVFKDDGTEVARAQDYAGGLEFGGGVDAFYWKRGKLRGTIQVSFRLLSLTYLACEQDCATVNWPDAANLPPGSDFDPNNPLAFLELDNPIRYKIDMNGWTLGFMLTHNF